MRADEHHLGNAHHFLAERVLGAIRLSMIKSRPSIRAPNEDERREKC